MKIPSVFFRILPLFLVMTGVSALSAWAQSPQEALQTLLASKSIDSANTAVYVWDLDADYSVASHKEDMPIVPASVMKCVTIAALSSAIPYDSRLKTKVYLAGKKNGKTFDGTLLVEGGGDPSLADGRLEDASDFINKIVRTLKNKGIERLDGNIEVDDSFFSGPSVHPSWGAGDLEQAYGTGCHAFNFEGNASGKKAVTNPFAVFKKKLIAAMHENGLEYSESAGKTERPRQLLLEYSSPRLGDLMRSCMFRSDNLYAESFLRLFGTRNGGDGSTDMSAKLASQYWDVLNFPLDGVEIVDGSGLSRDNRLTAEFLGTVLRNRMNDPEYVALFPLAGEEGTVKSFLKDTPLQGRMALKTGSMNGIQSYAGYLLDHDYMPTHVVVIMTNNLKNRGEFRSALGKFFMSLIH